MKILVSGANGQVGRELARLAGTSQHDVTALTRQQLDITDIDSVQKVFDKYQPDLFINAAAYTAVDKAEDDVEQAFLINKTGPENLAKACHSSATPLLQISTDYVFDGSKISPYEESDPVAPLGIYGESKWAGEEAVRENIQQHIIMRTSWVFGEHGNNFVKTILRVAGERDELNVVSDQLGSPTSAAAIAAALLKMADTYQADQYLPWGTYHFSGQPFTSWYGFAMEIVRMGRESGLLDHDVKINPVSTGQYPTPAKRPANSCLDSSLLTSSLLIDADEWQSALFQVLQSIKAHNS